MVCELGKHTECNEDQADSKHQKGDEDCLAIASSYFRWIRDIVHGCDLVEMAQILHHGLHACITLVWIAADRIDTTDATGYNVTVSFLHPLE